MEDIWAGDACIEDAYTEAANVKSAYIGVFYAEGACIESTFVRGAYAWRANGFTKGTCTCDICGRDTSGKGTFAGAACMENTGAAGARDISDIGALKDFGIHLR